MEATTQRRSIDSLFFALSHEFKVNSRRKLPTYARRGVSRRGAALIEPPWTRHGYTPLIFESRIISTRYVWINHEWCLGPVFFITISRRLGAWESMRMSGPLPSFAVFFCVSSGCWSTRCSGGVLQPAHFPAGYLECIPPVFTSTACFWNTPSNSCFAWLRPKAVAFSFFAMDVPSCT